MGKHIKKSPYTLIAGSAVFAIFFESFIDMDLMWADYTPVLFFLLLTIYGGADEAAQEIGAYEKLPEMIEDLPEGALTGALHE